MVDKIAKESADGTARFTVRGSKVILTKNDKAIELDRGLNKKIVLERSPTISKATTTVEKY